MINQASRQKEVFLPAPISRGAAEVRGVLLVYFFIVATDYASQAQAKRRFFSLPKMCSKLQPKRRNMGDMSGA